ncbi:MAG TPA: hypothetical protein VGH53_01550 [Streptosporangiaceae bacterium]
METGIAQVISLSPARHRDDVLTGAGLLPVRPALRELLPGGGLQRGSVVTTGDWGLLPLALAAGAVADGAWCAIVGVPAVGVRAAAQAGLDPERVLLVAEPGPGWTQVVASLLDGFDVVLLRPPEQPSAQLRRKLEAAARRYGSVLVIAGDWPGAQSRLLVADAEWTGIGTGYGRLRARQAQVIASGRGAGERARSAWLWLPGPDGAVAAAAEPADVARDSSRGGYAGTVQADPGEPLVSSG